MNTEQLAIFIGEKIKSYRKQFGWTQLELGKKIGMGKNAISNYEKGVRTPKKDTMFELANAFKVSIDDLFPPRNTTNPHVEITPSSPQNTTKISAEVIRLDKELKDPRHSQWISHGERLLEEQRAEQRAEELKRQETNKPKKGIVSELFEERRQRLSEEEEKSLHAITGITATAAASGLGRGYGYDDSDTYTVYTEEEPPKTYSFATMVKGDSMMPDYREGDMLYLHDKGVSSYSGMLAVVAYGDRTYFKKIYTEDEHLRLVSLNEKYEDILLDFPPSEDTHIRIFEVVGSFTPIEM